MLQVSKIRQQSVNFFSILGFLVADICGKVWGTSQFKKPIYFGFFGDCGQDMWVSPFEVISGGHWWAVDMNFLTPARFLPVERFHSAFQMRGWGHKVSPEETWRTLNWMVRPTLRGSALSLDAFREALANPLPRGATAALPGPSSQRLQ